MGIGTEKREWFPAEDHQAFEDDPLLLLRGIFTDPKRRSRIAATKPEYTYSAWLWVAAENGPTPRKLRNSGSACSGRENCQSKSQ